MLLYKRGAEANHPLPRNRGGRYTGQKGLTQRGTHDTLGAAMADETQQKIRKMDPVLASQVAAGEVVERPASVIKELVENSIDAGARSIRVEIRRGGISLIKVTDDGCGMSREDAEICLQRHATSKLKRLEDLFEIRQMGFRGEALPSIASVAELKITTRRAQDVEGTLVSSVGGEEAPAMNTGCAPGTEICVANLFFNTPVRRKFLKSEETEAGHIEHQLRLHALAFPEIRFCFVKDGQMVFDVPATSDMRHRIAAFYGRDIAASLLRIKPTHAAGVCVGGFLMPLETARRNRRMQFVFLNNRPIDDKIVARAIRDGYGGFPTGLHPVFFLYLEVEPALVDVNVHPAKREVRFRRPSDVTTTILDAISSTLSSYARGDDVSSASTTEAPPPCPRPQLTSQGDGAHTPAPPSSPPTLPFRLRPVLEPQQIPLNLPPDSPTLGASGGKPADTLPQALQTPESGTADPTPSRSHPQFRYIGLFRDHYAIFENRESLVLLSPRAARERIIFERLMESSKRPIMSQRLLTAELLEFDVRELGTIMDVKPLLEQAGFKLEQFGRSTLRIEAAPAILPLAKVADFLHELIELYSCGEQKVRRARHPFEPFACHLAKQYAKQEDMQPWLRSPSALIADLMRCEIPYCTPTGKPTMLPFTAGEINRKFQAQ